MKILLITQYFWPENFQINNLAKLLAKNGHHVTVLTGLPNYPQGRIYSGFGKSWFLKTVYQGVEVIRVPLFSRGKGGAVRLMLNYLSYAFFASAYSLFFLGRKKFDVAFVYAISPMTQMLPAMILKKIFKVPVFLWVQDLWPESLVATGKVNSIFVMKCVYRFVTAAYRSSDMILIQSSAFQPKIKRHGFPESRICYFPNSADEFYRPLSLLPSHDKYDFPIGFRIIFAGNMGAAQNIEKIMEAASILRDRKDIKWIFVGDGSERGFLEAEIKERGLIDNVCWKGSFPATEMPFLFSICDVLLLSLKKCEVFSLTIPSKLQTYLACGKPILAVLEGEAARIVTEAKAGLVVEPDNPKLLAEAVLNMKNLSVYERNCMGNNGFRYFQDNFEEKKLFKQLESYLLNNIK